MTQHSLERKHRGELARGVASFGKIQIPVQTELSTFIPHLLNYKEHGRVLETIAYATVADMPVLLIGETGVGKTAAIRHIAARTRNSLRRVNVNGSMTAEDFVGQLIVRNGATEWEDGVLTEAMRKGWWLVIDEINAASAEILFVLHSLLDDDRFIVLTGKPDREVVKAHKNFRLFATMNPPERYAGTKDMNKALLSRFAITIEVPIPPVAVELGEIVDVKLPKKQQEQFKSFLSEIRSAYDKEELETFVSPRDTRSIARVLAYTGSIATALELTVIPRGTKSEQKAIRQIARLHFAEPADKKGAPKTKAQADAELPPLTIGDTVVMIPTAKFASRGDKSNPVGMVGTVVSIQGSEHSVEWSNGTSNGAYLRGRDIVRTESAEGIAAHDWKGEIKVGDTVECIEGGSKGAGWKLGLQFKVIEITTATDARRKVQTKIYWHGTKASRKGVFEDSVKKV